MSDACPSARPPCRVVHALSSFNVYEDAIGNDTSGDDLVSAISDPNTQ